MNPFDTYRGINLNGRFWSRAELTQGDFSRADSQNHSEALAFAATLFDDTEQIEVTTSGSTGNPKKLSFPKSAFEISAKTTNAFFGLTQTSDTALVLPMTYIAGKMMVVRALVGQYNLDILEPSTKGFGDKKQYDFAPVTPFQMEGILEAGKETFVSRYLIGGGQVSPELKSKILARSVIAYASFGMTETLSHFALAKIVDSEKLWYTPLTEVEIKTDVNNRLQINYPGITDDWLQTGDLVDIENDQFCWVGRADFLINSGGVKLIPEEIEAQLSEKLTVPYFVFGIPHEKLGEAATLFIESDPMEINLDSIEWNKPFQMPKTLAFVKEFARTLSGKIKRKETAELWKGHQRD